MVETIENIKQKILDYKIKTIYGHTMFYLSTLTIIISFSCLIYNYFDRKDNLANVSNYLSQNLFYNKTRIYVSYMFITFVNFILIKSGFLKDTPYNNISPTDLYKEKLKFSIDSIFDLIKTNENLDEDFDKIFSNYSEIFIKIPDVDNYVKANLTYFQLIELIISEGLTFNYIVEDFLRDDENIELTNSLIRNIDNFTNIYIYYKYEELSVNDFKKTISTKFNKFPFVLLFICIIMVILLIIYSYILYIFTYYEVSFCVNLLNSNSKTFEAYTKSLAELKSKIKSLENEENEKNNDEINGENEGKIIHQYTDSERNDEGNFNEKKNTLR